MLTIHIEGMTCGHCERAVREALEKVPGVTRVAEVDRNEGVARIEGEPDPAAVVNAIQEEGYQARV